jgi:hypothetical protein
MDDSILMSEVSIQKRMAHIFAPFHCTYRGLDKSATTSCLSKEKPVFFGDSRDRFMVEHIERWLNITDEKFLTYRWWGIITRIGWMEAVGTPEDKVFTKATLSDYLVQNRTIILSGLLHDLADFDEYTSTEMVRKYYPDNECANCPGEFLGKCSESCNPKTNPIRSYIKNIDSLATILVDLIADFPNARIFWVSHHVKPPDLEAEAGQDSHFYSWQTHDIISSLETLATSKMESVGVKSINLRHMALAAPAYWWDDEVHYGRSPNSLFKHMSMQIALNHICD